MNTNKIKPHLSQVYYHYPGLIILIFRLLKNLVLTKYFQLY